ncbi:hypothetical protein IIC65_06190, partial [Candidatus Sumerlaeota bacterium]|nr:hypothetical protein [Candidatus Sumerlaeota bacterium]
DRRRELNRLASDLDRELEIVLSISNFIELAASTNAVGGSRANPNASPIAATDLDVSLLLGATRDEIKALEPGSWSKAYSEEVTVRAVGVTARSEASIRALDEVREEIESRLLARALPPIQTEIRGQWLEEIEYEFLLPLGP